MKTTAASYGFRTLANLLAISGDRDGAAAQALRLDVRIWRIATEGPQKESVVRTFAAHYTKLCVPSEFSRLGGSQSVSPSRGADRWRSITTDQPPNSQSERLRTPPLTTMAVSPYQLGRRLARVMLERIREPQMPVAVSEVPALLVVRETTGALGDGNSGMSTLNSSMSESIAPK